MRLFPSKIIGGCRSPEPLMKRWRILTTPWFSIKLHKFYRSDEDRELHDHPWAFISIILWRGYIEVTPPRSVRKMLLDPCQGVERGWRASIFDVFRKRYYPGSILFRPARWAHRVELVGGPSWSLVIVFPKVREWGFHAMKGWVDWRTFHGTAGCKDDIPEYERSMT